MSHSTTVILHRQQLDGDTASPALALTGPFTRSAPAPSVEAAVATVQQALPKDPVVVPPAPTKLSASTAIDLSSPEMLKKRMIRIVSFHKGIAMGKKIKHHLARYEDSAKLEVFFEQTVSQFGSELDIPASFEPIALPPSTVNGAPSQPPEDASNGDLNSTVASPEARVATFVTPDRRFSRTLMLPVSVRTVLPGEPPSVEPPSDKIEKPRSTVVVYGALA